MKYFFEWASRTLKSLKYKSLVFFKFNEEKVENIKNKIISGATPGFNYFLFLILSVLIASIGLVNNSTAVIIGAMLISPIMTPIFGASMAMVIGRSELFKKSLINVMFGVFLAVFSSMLLGLFPLTPLVLNEAILSRTAPNLFDLFIAAFAGIAGCIALVDDTLGESLPGVAISTSLTPPLGVSGLCLAMGKFDAAYGAFLLFFTNFLVMLLVSGLIFYFSGFVPRGSSRQQWLKLKKPFWVTVSGIFLICYPLGKALFVIHEERKSYEVIETIFREKLKGIANASIVSFDFKKHEDYTTVFAIFRSRSPFSPSKVAEMEDEISKELNTKAELVVRCNSSVELIAKNTDENKVRDDFGKSFIVQDDVEGYSVHHIERVVRSLLDGGFKLFTLDSLELVKVEDKWVGIMKIEGHRELFSDEVMIIENSIKKHLGKYDFKLFVSCNVNHLITTRGQTYFPLAELQKLSPEEKKFKLMVRTFVERRMKEIQVKPLLIDIAKIDGYWRVISEVVGDIDSKAVNELKEELFQKFKKRISIYIKPSIRYVIDHIDVKSEDVLLEKLFKKNSPIIENKRNVLPKPK